MWDVWIHILEIRAECACWGWGQSCRGHLIRLAFARHLPLKGKASGRPGVPPLRSEGNLYEGRVRTPAPTADGVWAKNAGAQCAPLHRVYERLYMQEKGQVWNLSLKTKKRNAVSHKISLLTFFFKESKRPRFTTGASYLCVL